MLMHVAIIPDGNRRWARSQGLPSVAGYPQGITVIENCCAWAIDKHIPFLSFYCFSTENLVKRPEDEVDNFIELVVNYAETGINYYINMGIKVIFNGRRDRLPEHIIKSISNVEEQTVNGTNLTLILCIDYSGKNEIVEAIAAGAKTEEELNNYMNRFAPDPDIIIRTSGIVRLSNFMLWQATYSELFFLPKHFPELTMEDLDQVLYEFENKRPRYYGGS